MRYQEAKTHAQIIRWRQVVCTCRNSGLSVAQWCQENGVAQSTYYRWLRVIWDQESGTLLESTGRPEPTLKEPERKMLSLPAFAEVSMPRPACAQGSQAACMVLRKGDWSLEIHNGTDPTLLRQILEVVK